MTSMNGTGVSRAGLVQFAGLFFELDLHFRVPRGREGTKQLNRSDMLSLTKNKQIADFERYELIVLGKLASLDESIVEVTVAMIWALAFFRERTIPDSIGHVLVLAEPAKRTLLTRYGGNCNRMSQ
jgi:hypothetical protein